MRALWNLYGAARGTRLPSAEPHRSHGRIACNAEFFRRHILDGLMPFWSRHAADTKFGGYLTHLRRDGSRYDTIKIAAMQARMMYAFADAYRFSGDPQNLDLAAHGLQFMREKIWDRRFGGWMRTVLRDGTQLDDEKRAFTEAYAIIGLTQYYAASRDRAALHLAQEAYALAKDSLYDARRGGYFLSCARNWSVISTRKTICSQLDILFAALSLYRQTMASQYLQDAVDLANLMLEHMYDRRFHCLVETCNGDWSYNPFATHDVTWIGHNLKGAWVLLQLFEFTQQEHFCEAARCIIDFSIRSGYDPINGGFFHYVFRSGPLASREKLWWTNCEALVALLLAIRLDDAREYIPYFNETLAFCMKSFYDAQWGEWYRACAADGTPSNSNKGGGDKAAYHTVQACAFAYEYLRIVESDQAGLVATQGLRE